MGLLHTTQSLLHYRRISSRLRTTNARRRVAGTLAGFCICSLAWASLSPGAYTQTASNSVQSGAAAGNPAQTATDISPLEQGKPVERELAAGQSHHYRFELVEGQYARVVLDKQSAGFVLIVFGPEGRNIAEAKGAQPQEPLGVVLVAKASGAHRVEVRSLAKEGAPARYKLSVAELRAAAEQDRNHVAAAKLYTEAMRLSVEGTPQSLRQSIEKFEAALPLIRASGQRQSEADMLATVAYVCARVGEARKALDFYQQSLPLYRDLGDRGGEASALVSIGNIYSNQRDHRKALEFHSQALPLYRQAGDRRGETATLYNIGIAHDFLGDKPKALEYYCQSLPMARAAADRRREAAAMNAIGGVYNSLGDHQPALDAYEQALALYRDLADRRGEAAALNSIARAYGALQEYEKSRDLYRQAHSLFRALDDRRGQAAALSSLGTIHNFLGESQQALDSFNQALAIYGATNDRRGQAGTLNSLGQVYKAFGDYQKALDCYGQALAIDRAAGDRNGEAAALHNLASVYISQGEYRQALDSFNQSLALLRGAGNRRGEAAALNGIAVAHTALNEHQKALDFYQQALPIARSMDNRRGEAAMLNNIGRTYYSLGDQQKALDFHNQALILIRTIKDRRGEAQMQYNIARAQRARGDLDAARAHIAEAIRLAESQRYGVSSQELRASLLASVRNFYELEIDLLMQLHKRNPSGEFVTAALETSERARARSLLELLAEGRVDLRQGVEPALLERERKLQRLLDDKAERQTQLLSGRHTPEQAAAAAKEIESLLTEYQQVQAQIRDASPRYGALTEPQPLSLKEIQRQVLDGDTLLLEYALGDERSYLWAVTNNSITSYELPKREEIEAAARKFYELAKMADQANTRAPAAATALSRMLLAPASDRLTAKRLIVVADGILHYIPFAALPAPSRGGEGEREREGKKNRPLSRSPARPLSFRPLVVDHEIVTLPSASVLAEMRRELAGRKPAAGAVAVFADPVFSGDDSRIRTTGKTVETPLLTRDLERSIRDVGLTIDGKGFPRLPFSRREAEAIVAIAPRGQWAKALDFQASRAAATSDDLSNYRVVHFATHGLLNSHHPELSGIVLSLVDQQGKPQNGFLRLHEIYNLKLPAELVVLSACQTGLGKEIRGEGLVGLTRGFMYAGTARVMASLWKVDDAATAELMKRFYRGVFDRGLSPAAALRAAQVEMWRLERFSAPYFWAAFTLQGEWR